MLVLCNSRLFFFSLGMKMKVDRALNIKFENLQEKYLLYCEEGFFFPLPLKNPYVLDTYKYILHL